VKPVPEGELLLAMCGIERVVDVEDHRRGRHVVAGTVDVYHLAPNSDQRAQVRRVFPSTARQAFACKRREERNRWLAGQPDQLSGGFAKRHHEGRVMPQGIQIVSVFVSTGNRQHPRPQNVRKAVRHPRRVPRIGDQGGEPIHDAKPPLGLSEQQNTGIRRDRTPIECAGDFLGANDWKRERNLGRIGHGGRAISVR
jgi:hypothetical protein